MQPVASKAICMQPEVKLNEITFTYHKLVYSIQNEIPTTGFISVFNISGVTTSGFQTCATT